MDGERFDRLTRRLAGSGSRRAALRLLAGGALGTTLTRLGLDGVAAQDACLGTSQECAAGAECCSTLCSPDLRGDPPERRCCLAKGKRCKKAGQCCSRLCSRETGRCICRGAGKDCTAETAYTCCSGKCGNDGRCLASCVPEEKATTCGAKGCGTKTNNCGQPVACGGCGAGEACRDGTCAADCGQYETVCNRVCVDTRGDPDHCGACGVVCPDGQACSWNGTAWVCSAGCNNPFQKICNRRCIQQTSCCDGNCGSGICMANGLCCFRGAVCGGECVSPIDDERHCGGCGRACPAGWLCCDGWCVDPASNRAHCGGCFGACQAGAICQNGACQCDSDQGYKPCDGGCIRFDQCCRIGTSYECQDGKYCQADRTCACPTGTKWCDRGWFSQCIPVGDCCRDADCSGTTHCSQGLCCPAGLSNCGDVCVDKQTDPNYCGRCSRTCGSGEVCRDGYCCRPKGSSCSHSWQCCGRCENDDGDFSHCT